MPPSQASSGESKDHEAEIMCKGEDRCLIGLSKFLGHQSTDLLYYPASLVSGIPVSLTAIGGMILVRSEE